MKNHTATEISKLQDSLQVIRKAGRWTTEEFGNMIGVTKQTISNLENKKTTMTKTQYIAIRVVLDYEMAAQPDNKVLATAVNLYLNSEGLSKDDMQKAQAFMEGATTTGLADADIMSGLAALLTGVAATMISIAAASSSGFSLWIDKIMRDK